MIGSFTLLNLFVAVILDHITAIEKRELNPLKPDRFAEIWRYMAHRCRPTTTIELAMGL